ncbi:MAG: hypothetical protein NTY96_02630 [Bacteroidetes bacterium]|nr:hypothetical protein [Bacteroidota bacterium]
MAHHDLYDDHSLSHEELKYREHTERAAHFIKIDLFRSAREEFKAALEYKPGDEKCLLGMTEMNANIRRDKKVVLVVAPIVLAIIAAVACYA